MTGTKGERGSRRKQGWKSNRSCQSTKLTLSLPCAELAMAPQCPQESVRASHNSSSAPTGSPNFISSQLLIQDPRV